MSHPLYCLKGLGGVCWWTLRPTPREAWEAGYPKSPTEPENCYVDRIGRVQKLDMIECVCVTLKEAS